jgi:hypothetical protein
VFGITQPWQVLPSGRSSNDYGPSRAGYAQIPSR